MSDLGKKTIPPTIRWLAMATAGLLIVQLGLNQALQTSAAPEGMLNFQLATTKDNAVAIVQSWQGDAQSWARASLWSGHLFAIVYTSMLIALTGHLLMDRPGVRERKTGRWVKGLFITAGLVHVCEYAILLVNLDRPDGSLSLTATLLALINYTALVLGLAGLVVIRAARRHPLHPNQA